MATATETASSPPDFRRRPPAGPSRPGGTGTGTGTGSGAPPGWRDYPLGLEGYDAVFVDGEAYNDRLRELAGTLFGEVVDVRVLDAPADPSRPLARTDVRDPKRDERLVLGAGASRFKAISIPQQHTLAPFSITEELMRKILAHHAVPPKFLDLLFGFGDKTRSSEEGFGGGIRSASSAQSQDICYQLRYVESNHRSRGNPWSLRQTGVFHRFDLSGNPSQNLWIFLHPKHGSKGQRRFEAAVAKELESGETDNNPIRLHLSLMTSYLDGWRWYLHDLGRSYLETESMVLASDIEDRADYTLTFNTLQSLRHLEEKLIPLPAIFRATMTTMAVLTEMNDSILKARPEPDPRLVGVSCRLATLSAGLEGHLASVGIMQKRVRSVIELVSDGLNLRNQATAAEINHHLLTLTKDTVDDSATVRVVTLVTLIYLPASFIASFYGMDFFNFDSTSKQIVVANDFWIYVATTVPLTVMTVAYWQYRTFQQRKRREMRSLNDKHQMV